MERFEQKDSITFRTSITTTAGSKGGYNDLTNGVATKYLNNYLTRFQVLESIQHRKTKGTMNDLIIKGNLIRNVETYDTLRLSSFTI